MRQRRVTIGTGLSTGLGTTVKYVRRTSSGTAGNGLGATGNNLGTTIKYL
jgi:hypothetical protein